MSKLVQLEFCIPALLMASCTVDSSVLDGTRQAQNGNTLSLSELASGALNTARLDSRNAALMGMTASGRQVLSAAVGCALSSTQTITYSLGGITYSMTGGLAIAPSWMTAALTPTQAAWVSACLFAHVNDVNNLIWISVRGNDANLAATNAERTEYQIEEGAFWGNAFADLGQVAAYSCVGVDQAADDSVGDLPLRQCAQWDGVSASHKSTCGMSYAGPCSSVCATPIAPYTGCSFLGSAAAGSVVTIFLAGAPPR